MSHGGPVAARPATPRVRARLTLRVLALAGAALAAALAPAAAQDRSVTVAQEPSAVVAPEAGVAQIQSPITAEAAPQGPGPSDASPPTNDVTSDAQLTPQAAAATPTAQLADRSAAAAPAANVSTPEQGRTAEAAPVGGRDRCAPGDPRAADPRCARVLERRAAEFAAPAPAPLSPEQRLLAAQRQLDAQTVGDAARRLAAGEMNENDPSTQAVAAIALQRRQTEEGEVAAAEDVALSAGATLGEIIANALAQTQPPPRQ